MNEHMVTEHVRLKLLTRSNMVKYMTFNVFRGYKISVLAMLKYSFPLRKLVHAMYRDFFSTVKLKISLEKKKDDIFAQNIDC